MIMKKVTIDGKEVYEVISKEEAKERMKKNEKLVFTDEDEEDELEDEIDEEEEKEEEEDEDEDDEEKNKTSTFNYSDKINKVINDAFNSIGNINVNIRSKKSNSLASLVPFMSKEDLHELTEKILNDDQSLGDVNVYCLLPFLSRSDCDLLLMKAIKGETTNYKFTAIAPFVSKECLSVVVDEIISGKIPYKNIDGLYPFMNSKDVKRLFNYIISKREE